MTASVVIRNFIMVLLCLNSGWSTLAGIFAFVELCQLDRVEQILDLCLGKNLLFANDLEKTFAALVGLIRELGRLVVAEYGIESRHDPDCRFHMSLEHTIVDGDPVDALRAQGHRGVVEKVLRLHDRKT